MTCLYPSHGQRPEGEACPYCKSDAERDCREETLVALEDVCDLLEEMRDLLVKIHKEMPVHQQF